MAVSIESIHHRVRYLGIGSFHRDVVDSTVACREVMLSPTAAMIRGDKNLAATGKCPAGCRIDRAYIGRSDADRIYVCSAVIESGTVDNANGVQASPPFVVSHTLFVP